MDIGLSSIIFFFDYFMLHYRSAVSSLSKLDVQMLTRLVHVTAFHVLTKKNNPPVKMGYLVISLVTNHHARTLVELVIGNASVLEL